VTRAELTLPILLAATRDGDSVHSTRSGRAQSPGSGEVPAAAADDVLLVRLAQAGDTQAFGELVERNRRAVYRAIYAVLGSATDADDVAQEAFVTAYRKLSSFRGEASFKTWMLSIAWRKAIDRRKSITKWLRLSAPRETFGEESTDIVERVASGDQTHEERMAADELQRTLKRLITTLPRKLRDVLLLAASGEHSYEEIATALAIPVGTVKWRVSEARRVLKEKLAALGYGHE
jgi:RNA polymerase sigma-70 factor (ECF subfamily)